MTKTYNFSSTLHKKQFGLITAGQKRLDIIKPATINDGICLVENQDECLELHQKAVITGRIMKFLPASGAATRMSRSLLTISKKIKSIEDLEELAEQENKDALFALTFIMGIKNFSFYEDIEQVLMRKGLSVDKLLTKKDFITLFDYVLGPTGLNFSSLPKALVNFHKYGDEDRTALEEQVLESINVVSDRDSKVVLHLTIQENYRDDFITVQNKLTSKYSGNDIEIEYSIQDPQSNSIALDKNDDPIIVNGEFVLHPSGHGALLTNLNNVDGDIIQIKNIDNVPRTDKDTQNIYYKKVLIGYLIKQQKKIFYFIDLLEKRGADDTELLKIVEYYVGNELHVIIKDSYKNYSAKLKKEFLLKILNRPIRVCGMIKNTGDPGGGPFWVKDSEGNITLQIIEQSQIMQDQKNLLSEATHFNPVDMICAVRNYKGAKFNLMEYRDENTYLVSRKHSNGDEIKIYENPGLWNGGMAYWNTFFVEVPNSTFAPVKEVNDLLKEEHQPN